MKIANSQRVKRLATYLLPPSLPVSDQTLAPPAISATLNLTTAIQATVSLTKTLLTTMLRSTIILVTILFGNPVNADSLSDVLSQGAVGTKAARQSQLDIDKLNSDTAILLGKYQSAISEISYLNAHNAQLAKQIRGQEGTLAELERAMGEVQVIERQLGPLLEKMINRLDDFVQVDKPFSIEERQQRIAHLRKAIDDHDLSISEKFRQVMDAYAIEIEYGNTIESYNDSLAVNGSTLDVNVLRIGRIALVFQTADEQTSGVWNEENKRWEVLPNKYRRSIRQGIRLTRNQATTELILTPVMLDLDNPEALHKGGMIQ